MRIRVRSCPKIQHFVSKHSLCRGGAGGTGGGELRRKHTYIFLGDSSHKRMAAGGR